MVVREILGTLDQYLGWLPLPGVQISGHPKPKELVW